MPTVYHTPLALINGRDNNGKILTFFMGFIREETKESFAWFLRSFMGAYVVAPKFLGCDQAQATLNVLEEVLPTTLIVLHS